MKFLLGTKEYMTQIFDEEGTAHPVTALTVTPATVLQVKSPEKEGYSAVQVGFGSKQEKNIRKPQKGHFADLGAFRHVREFTPDASASFTRGDSIGLDIFSEGESVTLSAVSKGKGFQGVVKRHGFGGGRRTHGQKHSEREPGSIGVGGVQRVFKGLRMAGRMGTDRITNKNVTIVKVDPETNTIYVRGAVPGRKGTLVEIRAASPVAAK